MSEFDFDDVFDKTHDEIPPVHDVPAGLWRFKVKAAKRFEPKDDGEVNGGLLFVSQAIEASGDVDPSLVPDDLDNLEEVFYKIFIGGNKDMHQAWRFVEKLGMDTAGRSMTECLAQAAGFEFWAVVSHKPREDGDGVWINLKEIASIGDVDE